MNLGSKLNIFLLDKKPIIKIIALQNNKFAFKSDNRVRIMIQKQIKKENEQKEIDDVKENEEMKQNLEKKEKEIVEVNEEKEDEKEKIDTEKKENDINEEKEDEKEKINSDKKENEQIEINKMRIKRKKI